MTEEQIKEVMRLGELWSAYAWKACSHGADETVKSQAGRAALEAYLRTIGEPEQSVNAELLEALKYARRFLNKSAHDTDYLDAAIARAESAIETPAKVSPCACHAAQQDADIAKDSASLQFKCWTCLDTGFLMKPMIAPEPPDVKCPNGCKPKKGGAA